MTKIVTVTEAALRQMKRIVQTKNEASGIVGIRFGVKAGGCSGLEYLLEPITNAGIKDDDYVKHLSGLKIYINAKSIPYVEGTIIDWGLMGFVFNNPQVKSTCGCGTSFELKQKPR